MHAELRTLSFSIVSQKFFLSIDEDNGCFFLMVYYFVDG